MLRKNDLGGVGFFVLLLLGLLFGCTDEDALPGPSPPLTEDGSRYRVIVGNEGGFTYGNASISQIDSETGVVSAQLFQGTNQRALGDVLQDLQVIDGRWFAVLNNSGRIEVFDTLDYQHLGSITGMTSPRYLLPVADRKMYVTDFQADAIHIIDPIALEKTGEIPLAGWTEELIQIDEEIWVTNRYNEYLYVLDPKMDAVIDSVAVGYGPGAVALDRAGKLWVYCAGDISGGRAGGLYRVDPKSRRILRAYPLSADLGLYPRMTFNRGRDTLLYLQDGLRILPITAQKLPEKALISSTDRNWYGLGYDPVSREIWLCDAADFQRRGEVFRYDWSGRFLDVYPAGVIPALIRIRH